MGKWLQSTTVGQESGEPAVSEDSVAYEQTDWSDI